MATAASALTVHFCLPPREMLFLHRRLTGMFMLLAALDVSLTRPRLGLAPHWRSREHTRGAAR